ncbi:MAG: AMP-binding protein, partial [Proteobacteria bacterium]|nr:AMP-binding protein [Pseudomonadota bacterium]
MDRFWVKQYPPGTPTDINPDEYTSIKQLIEGSFRDYPTRTAYIQMEQRLSYAQLDRLSAQFAAWLQQRGMRKGDRIAIMLPNILQYPIVMFGALRAGLTIVNTNPLYTASELEHQLRDSGAHALVVLENFAAVAQQALAIAPVPNVIVTGVGDLLSFPKGAIVNFVIRHVQRKVPAWHLPDALPLMQILKGPPATPAPVEVGHDDIAYLQYTGGTTGVSKGAMLTHGNMIANILQARAWFKQVQIDNTTYVCALP